jgi:hypothetical protein
VPELSAGSLSSSTQPFTKIKVSFLNQKLEAVMARTPGAKNRTPRELRAEAKRLNEKATLLEKINLLKKKKK